MAEGLQGEFQMDGGKYQWYRQPLMEGGTGGTRRTAREAVVMRSEGRPVESQQGCVETQWAVSSVVLG